VVRRNVEYLTIMDVLMFRRRRANKTIQWVLCLFSLLMLVTLPIQRSHEFRVHYRSDRVRRTLEHHSELAQSAPGAVDRVVKEAWRPAEIWWIEPEPALTPVITTNEFTDRIPVPISKLLSRLKLGRSSSGGQDPLVHLA
jgi:hypothetical protein